MASLTDYERGLTDFERGLLHKGVQPGTLPPLDVLSPLIVPLELMQKDNRLVFAAMPDGSGFVGPSWLAKVESHAMAQRMLVERTLKTGENIASGIFGALGYMLGGDEGSDVGAIVDGLAFIGSEHPLNSQNVVGIAPPRGNVVRGAPAYERSVPTTKVEPVVEPSPAQAMRSSKAVTPSIGSEQRKVVSPTSPVAPESRATQNRLGPMKPAVRPTKPVPVNLGTIEGPLEVKNEVPQTTPPQKREVRKVFAQPPKADGAAKPNKAAVKKAASDSEDGAAATNRKSAPKSKPVAPPPKRKGERLPSPAKAESEVNDAIDRDTRGLPANSYRTFKNKSLGTISAELLAIRPILEKDGKGKILANINEQMLPLGAADFINQRPALKAAYDRLFAEAKQAARRGNRTLLDEEIPNFFKSGTMENRRPDNVVVRFDIESFAFTDSGILAETVVVTDTTLTRTRESVRMHEFKTFFYGEAIMSLLGLDAKLVTAYEYNPALNFHRPALSPKSPPKTHNK